MYSLCALKFLFFFSFFFFFFAPFSLVRLMDSLHSLIIGCIDRSTHVHHMEFMDQVFSLRDIRLEL